MSGLYNFNTNSKSNASVSSSSINIYVYNPIVFVYLFDVSFLERPSSSLNPSRMYFELSSCCDSRVSIATEYLLSWVARTEQDKEYQIPFILISSPSTLFQIILILDLFQVTY